MSCNLDLIVPDWPAPEGIRAFSTTRLGGVSSAPWGSLNLGGHVGDNPEQVRENRQKLAECAGLPLSGFCFMDQVHGTEIAELPANSAVQADGCVTSHARVPCLVMAADCLPVLFCNLEGTRVAAAHAGWRGLCKGVLEQTVARFDDPEQVMVWLGPAIGPRQFEVGAEVRDAFIGQDPDAHKAFVPVSAAEGFLTGRFLADLFQLARQRLRASGVTRIYGGHWCTFSESQRFFSYRRDGVTGRMASLIFIN